MAKTPIQIHLYDTGFCPSLLKTPKGIIVKPVVDVTQKNNYTCEKSNLNSLRFHGHWVLKEMLSGINESKIPIEITPIIIFDDQGKQSLSFWKRAMEYSQEEKASFIFAAAGFPLPTKKEMVKSAEISIPKIPLFLSAGRKGKSLLKETLLFPQVHENKDHIFIIGSFHEGMKEADTHFSDPQLMAKESIDFYFPFTNRNSKSKNLKGSSFSLAKMGSFLLKNCLEQKIKSCFKEHEASIRVKEGKSLKELKTLK
ncbi:MAG: hypothetical protein NXH75_13615 [Halobacteriovoraceae bacterium]|nr:hypothetical protein [Halobacteriovoraceae bacterium]